MPYSQDQFDEFTRRLLYSGSELRDYNRGKTNPRWKSIVPDRPENEGIGALGWTIGAFLALCVFFGLWAYLAPPWPFK